MDPATAVRPRARAAIAVPRRARRVILRLYILASSHRNDGDFIAARDSHDWAGRGCGTTRSTGRPRRTRLVQRLGRYSATLEARHVSARSKGSVGVDRTVGHREQQLTLLRRVGILRDLHVA